MRYLDLPRDEQLATPEFKAWFETHLPSLQVQVWVGNPAVKATVRVTLADDVVKALQGVTADPADVAEVVTASRAALQAVKDLCLKVARVAEAAMPKGAPS